MSRKSITKAGLGALALTAALATSVVSGPATARAEYLGFPDISAGQGQWYVDYGVVDWAEEHSIINGIDGNWAPNVTVDRGQAAAILFNYSGDAEPSDPADFDDADQLGWAAGACAWAQDEGVFNGNHNADGSVTMDPWDSLTREQAAAILFNMSGDAEGDVSVLDEFPDGHEVSGWAKGAVAWGVEHEVLGNAGELNPTDTCTRAEFVAMLKNVVDPGWTPGGDVDEPGTNPGGGSGGGVETPDDDGDEPGTNPGGGSGGDVETPDEDEDESGTNPGGGSETNPGGGSGGDVETPGDDEDEPSVSAKDISNGQYKIYESGHSSVGADGMGSSRYNGHKMFSYVPWSARVVGPDGRALRVEGDDSYDEYDIRVTSSIDYANDTITYVAQGIGDYTGTLTLTVGFSRFSSVYLATPECPVCGSSCDAGYYGSFPSVTQLYAYRCVDAENENPHECDYCEGKLISELLIDKKELKYDQRLASDEEVLSQDLYCTNPSCSMFGKNLKGKAIINVNEMKPFDSYDTGREITYH